MEDFKIVDCWISTGLIIAFCFIGFLEARGDILHNHFFTGYFVVGGWQVISMLVHAYKHFFTHKYGVRYIYHWITFVAVVTMPGSFWVLLFTAPFMAVFYTALCFSEVKKMNQRPLALLK